MAKQIRSRQFMFEQQVSHLPYNINELTDYFEKSGAVKWAYIIHDNDFRQDDPVKLAEPHVHGVLQYENAHELPSVAKSFVLVSQYVEKWTGRLNNAWSYLIHTTSDAQNQNKYQYSPSDVVAFFDFTKEIEKISQRVSENDTNSMLDMYAEKVISLENLRKSIGVRNFAKNRRNIDDITITIAELHHAEWLKNHDPDSPMHLIWIWREAGTGKSRMANSLTANILTSKGGASNDYFQSYQGKPAVILNDLRPEEFSWSNFLKPTDPWERDKEAPRRYRNVPLNLELLIVTTPFSPHEFYKYSIVYNRKFDTVDQLLRRISQTIHLDEFHKFDPTTKTNLTLTNPNNELPF